MAWDKEKQNLLSTLFEVRKNLAELGIDNLDAGITQLSEEFISTLEERATLLSDILGTKVTAVKRGQPGEMAIDLGPGNEQHAQGLASSFTFLSENGTLASYPAKKYHNGKNFLYKPLPDDKSEHNAIPGYHSIILETDEWPENWQEILENDGIADAFKKSIAHINDHKLSEEAMQTIATQLHALFETEITVEDDKTLLIDLGEGNHRHAKDIVDILTNKTFLSLNSSLARPGKNDDIECAPFYKKDMSDYHMVAMFPALWEDNWQALLDKGEPPLFITIQDAIRKALTQEQEQNQKPEPV